MRFSSRPAFWIVQAAVLALVGVSAAVAAFRPGDATLSWNGRPAVSEPVLTRTTPLVIEPFYDEPGIVSDEDLAAVLAKVQPRFPLEKLKPNWAEHALRAWSIRAKFQDPAVRSGEQLKEFLTDHGRYLAAWGEETEPLLLDQADGVAVRWGRETGASVHHDHWLASLTEAGVSLDEPVFTPSHHDRTIRDVLHRAMLDFRVDEVEVEWSAMAFGLWLPEQKSWINREGREVSFDLLVERLVRGHQKYGVCAGTHRVYSLMVLLRLDEEFHMLSPEARRLAWTHLEFVRDQISVCQFPDGHWPTNWSDGKSALDSPIEDELYKRVIATGHHLEWLAIAPRELHPPREQIEKAAAWVVKTTKELSQEEVIAKYTFFSHVGNALALWRKTHPADFWEKWEATHPYVAPPAGQVKAVKATPEPVEGH